MAAAGPFPFHDPVGPDAAAPARDLRVVGEVLVPIAANADRFGLNRTTLDRLSAEGLLGSPLAPAAAQRELAEVIAGCDATTWFSWVQHQSPLRALEDARPGPDCPGVDELRSTVLPGLRSGHQLAAVAFAHLRRMGPPNPIALRVEGGWLLNGTLDWVTSWDLADIVMVMVQGVGDDAGSIVCALLPAGGSGTEVAGLRPGPPLDLLAMSGTHTRPLTLTDVLVPVGSVVTVLDRDAWLAADEVSSANANPSAFGVARGAIAELDSIASERSDEGIARLGRALVEECRLVRRRAYGLIDQPEGALAERLALRAASLDLVTRATTAVIVARAGAAMKAGCDAERRVREAMFLQVQAQTGATRAASVERLAAYSRHVVANLSEGLLPG
jgi:alkylation response protein AidB-like acyl-CoA dehydrogenase